MATSQPGDDGATTPSPSRIVLAYRPPPPQLVRAHRRRRREGGRGASAAVVAGVAAAAVAALALAVASALPRRRDRRRKDNALEESNSHNKKKKKQNNKKEEKKKKSQAALSPLPPVDPTLPQDLAAAVPPSTLRPLCALLEAVYSLRGWRGGGYHYERAWERCLDEARSPRGGNWQLEFDARDPQQVTPAALRSLARCVDSAFFGGALHRGIMRRLWEEDEEEGEGGGGRGRRAGSARRRLAAALKAAAEVVKGEEEEEEEEANEGGGDDDDDSADDDHKKNLPTIKRLRRLGKPWRHLLPLVYAPDPLQLPDSGDYVAAYDSSDHAVRVSRASWARKRGVVATATAPLNCEGWRVESLLAALAHSMAHELVHAMVAACFPKLELSEGSYLGEDGERHGPAFALLNRQIFGHTSADALEHAAGGVCGGGRGGWREGWS
jgi:hypothetical protein